MITISQPHMRINFQNGPIKENGVNGVQAVDVLNIVKLYLEECNRLGPCIETQNMIEHIESALAWDKVRTERRVAQNVEGTNEVHASL